MITLVNPAKTARTERSQNHNLPRGNLPPGKPQPAGLPKSKCRQGYYSECTRDEAFGLILDTREPLKRRVYYWLLVHGPATRWEIKDGLKLELSSVCARVNELMHEGVLEELPGDEGKKFNSKTKKNNRLLCAVPVNGQRELF